MTIQTQQPDEATASLRTIVAQEVARVIEGAVERALDRRFGAEEDQTRATIPKAARIAGVTQKTIRRWGEQGKLTIRLINRRGYVDLPELAALGRKGSGDG